MTVHRDPKRLLREAEYTLGELRHSRAVLEVAFDGEVGFGLGPTLEFYTLVSHNLMFAELNLWHGHDFTPDGLYLIAPPPGLYPRPLPKNIRASQAKEVGMLKILSRLELQFRFCRARQLASDTIGEYMDLQHRQIKFAQMLINALLK